MSECREQFDAWYRRTYFCTPFKDPLHSAERWRVWHAAWYASKRAFKP